jgi:cysteine-rich repeat protein
MNITTFLCQSIACNSSQTAVAGVCRSCSTLYDIHCTQCNITSCSFCTNGYVYSTTSLKCELRKVFGCGDGFWVPSVENCDDWNLANGDGCDSNCQPEADYVCNIADKQPIGTSLCKYTKNFTISLNYMQKDPYSNTANLFFTIEPAGFLQWTS